MEMKLKDILLIINILKERKKKLTDLSIIELGEQELKLWKKDTDNEYIKKWMENNPRIWPIRPPSNRMGFFFKRFF